MRPAHSGGAPPSRGSPPGSGSASPAGTVRYPAYPPSASQPVYSERGHRFSAPRVQYRHTLSVRRSHATPTRSPLTNPDTASPQPATSPTTSCPGTTFGRCTGRSPSSTCRSVRHTAQTRTRTSSSSAPGRGTGTVARRSVPGATTCQARIDSADKGLHRRRERRESLLDVGEVHAGARVGVELVVDPGVPVAHRALDHDDAAGVVDVEDGHAGDRVAGAARGRVVHVVGTAHEAHVA